jgi:hypothetical protein
MVSSVDVFVRRFGRGDSYRSRRARHRIGRARWDGFIIRDDRSAVNVAV